MKYFKFYLLTIGIILIDQTSKLLVHEYMYVGEEIKVMGLNWFRINYVLNPGMAFGMQLESDYGKLILTIFRLLATFGIGYYLYSLISRRVHRGLLWSMAMILGGAIGNLIDSIFYGVLLDNAPIGAPSAWFHGQVIDMLFFPLFRGAIPGWIPGIGGESFLFFSAVFNIADSSIFLGVVTILIMQKRFFPQRKKVPQPIETEVVTTESTEHLATDSESISQKEA